MIVVLGSVVAREGHFDEVLALSHEHVIRSRAEPGCISHAVHRDTENPSRLVFVERWETQEALWTHFKVPASRAFGKALAALAAEEPEMSLYDATTLEVPRRNAG
jgi:quinol monooxygenase YgiN